MATRRGNPSWDKSEPTGQVISTITEFEQVTRELNLQPDQYIRSTHLREWARLTRTQHSFPSVCFGSGDLTIESSVRGLSPTHHLTSIFP